MATVSSVGKTVNGQFVYNDDVKLPVKQPTQIQPAQTPVAPVEKQGSILDRVRAKVTQPTQAAVPQATQPTYVDKSQEMYGAGVTKPVEPVQPTQTPQQTTPTQPTETPTEAPQDEWVGQSRTEEQQLQDSIDKTQQELMTLRNREDALGQAEYLKKTKELQEYQAKQKEITDKQKAMSEEQAQIQSSAKLREAQRSLSQLKRNTAYLNSQGLGQSAEALDAFSQQISNAEQVYKEMQQYEQYAEEMRKLGYEFDTNAYERSMKEQQDELDKYVSDTIQDIFNNMSAAEMAGQMDTVEEVDAFATKYFNSIDTDIANMTRKQIAIAEQKLIAQTQQIERAREFVANKAIVNKDMSAAMGYYVDGNGQPMLDAATGSFIPTPAEAPLDPIFDKATGKLITFTTGPDGLPVANVQQVIDQPTFSANTIQNMIQAVSNGTMTVPQALEILPPEAQQQFLDKVGGITKGGGEAEKTVTVESADGSKSIMQRNPQTQRYDIPVQPSGFTPNGTPVNTAIQTALEKCKTGAQCGKFVNDILEGVGLPRLVKDSYQSKEMAISQIGIATTYDDLGSGSIFSYPVKGSPNGHIGIVTSVNDDGTINIMDFNYKGDEQRRERQNVDPAEVTSKGGMFSKPIIRDDTVQQGDGTLSKVADYLIKNQPRGPGYSEADVEMFTNAVKEYERTGNKDMLAQQMRDVALSDKNISETFYSNNDLINGISQVRSLLDSYEKSGGDTSILVNMAETVANKFGTTTSTELAKAKNQLGLLVANYIRSISGTAASDTEVARLVNNLPQIKNVKSLNMALIDQIEDQARKNVKSRLDGKYKFAGDMVQTAFPEIYGNEAGTSADINDPLGILR